MRKKVLVGMSGGVDSATTAALLIEKGYDVSGVTLSLTTPVSGSDNIEDARTVAALLQIPHFVWDYKDLFREKVVDGFVSAYLNGSTPNPCIECNRNIKFGVLLSRAVLEGYDYIATGHYAKIMKKESEFLLCKGADNKKDQSYFLYKLTQDCLSKTLFPLGDYSKEETRQMAKRFDINVASKPDSQEICFIPDNDYGRFIKEYTKKEPLEGDILDGFGNVVGRHSGIYKYTIGQRKGVGAFGRPVFVTSINPMKNEITIGEVGDEMGNTLIASNINMISAKSIDKPVEVSAKIRYKAPPSNALITPIGGGEVKVEFSKPQRAITPGQAVVFYDGDMVLGGGTIVSG